MVHAVAIQVTLTGKGPGRVKCRVCRATVGGRDNTSVEVDQLLVITGMGIMADVTGGTQATHISAHHMPLPGYVETVSGKTLVTQDTITTVTLITEGIGRGALRCRVIGLEFTLQQMGKIGSVGPVWTIAVGLGSIVIVVTIGTVNPAATRIQTIDQAGNRTVIA